MDGEYYTLITGASEGFGKALAFECAGRKMNLVLVALPGDALDSLDRFLRKNFDVKVIAIGMDLSKEDNCFALYQEIRSLGIRIDILINNAGIGSTFFFEEGSARLYQQQIKLNVLATTLLTRLFMEMLRSRKPSYILNVGSLSCFFFTPKKQVYGGTKSFVYFFSKSLRRELMHSGIHVSVICPGGMNTNKDQFLQLKSVGWIGRLSLVDPERVARLAMDGLLRKKAVIIPGRLNRWFMVLDKLLPAGFKTLIVRRQMEKIKPAWSLASLPSPLSVIQESFIPG